MGKGERREGRGREGEEKSKKKAVYLKPRIAPEAKQ